VRATALSETPYVNIVVICSDTFRYDHLGISKRQAVQTPHLDALIRESAVFTNSWLCSFPTLVNRIEVFTGRYTFPLYDWGELPYEFPVLSEVFRRHGYKTALIADNPHLFEGNFGFERGFDFVKDVPGQAHDSFQKSWTPMIELKCPPEKLGPPVHRINRYRRNAWWYRQQGTNTTQEVFRSAIEWLQPLTQRFFLWIDAFDPHEPWDAPDEFLKPYPWQKDAAAVFWPQSGSAGAYSPGELENMKSLYKAEVSQIDFWVGRFMDHLRESKLLEDTTVIFCSDHGYYFGEHGLLGKPLRHREPLKIYEELGHLPLIVRHPHGLGAGEALRGLTQPPDLYATALDLAGLPSVSWAQGHSLLPSLTGAPSPQRFAVGGSHPHKGIVGCLSAWTDEWYLVYSPMQGLEGSELYDQASDPTHTKNVISANRGIAVQLFDELNNWLTGLGIGPERQRQLLHNEPFTWQHHRQYKQWVREKRRNYMEKYRDYSQGG
jgi:arylsulfatase A-like enzyme